MSKRSSEIIYEDLLPVSLSLERRRQDPQYRAEVAEEQRRRALREETERRARQRWALNRDARRRLRLFQEAVHPLLRRRPYDDSDDSESDSSDSSESSAKRARLDSDDEMSPPASSRAALSVAAATAGSSAASTASDDSVVVPPPAAPRRLPPVLVATKSYPGPPADRDEVKERIQERARRNEAKRRLDELFVMLKRECLPKVLTRTLFNSRIRSLAGVWGDNGLGDDFSWIPAPGSGKEVLIVRRCVFASHLALRTKNKKITDEHIRGAIGAVRPT